MPARVIVFAGPSGAGKSHHAERTGLPILRLDDFYKEAGDPTLPCTDLGGGSTVVDWDDPASWNLADALGAIEQLCTAGVCEVPTYDIGTSRRVGRRTLSLDGAELFIAEGIFAHEVVPQCQVRGVLAAALCITQHPLKTAVRRFVRDVRERRKPPLILVRRGLYLLRRHNEVVRAAAARGCRVVSPAQAFETMASLSPHPEES